jgi:secreted PhoX family phosphatase
MDAAGSNARFTSPSGVAVDAAGNVYVADKGNNTVRKITPAGVVTTLAGSPLNTGTKDGAGIDAWFNGPSGVSVDATGNVYVTDSNNQTIRKITQSGVVSTLGGAAGTVGSVDGTGSTVQFPGRSGSRFLRQSLYCRHAEQSHPRGSADKDCGWRHSGWQ